MVSNRLLLCIVLLAVPLPSRAVGVQKPSEPATKDVTVIGVISGTSALVRVDKLTANSRTQANGDKIAELPRQSEYYVGTIYQVRVHEIIKSNKLIRAGQTITIMIPGAANVSDRVVLSLQRKYLLKLSLLDEDVEKYKRTAVMDLARPSAAKPPFDPHNVFTVISDVDSAVPVTSQNKGLIDRIRREANKK